MKLTTAATTTTTTKTGTITVADIRKKFRIPAAADVRLIPDDEHAAADTAVVATVTHVVEAAK